MIAVRWLLVGVLGLATGCPSDGAGRADAGAVADAGAGDARPDGDRRIVILMIGDGMGRGQLEATSYYVHGEPEALAMYGLPVRGELTTGGPSGITDSAAAATAMATGVFTFNARVGTDRDGQAVETLVELAHAEGLPAGIVTTASLAHATPGAFTAHELSRHDYVAIADDQILETRPEVMLGGGAQYVLPSGPGSERSDDGLVDELEAAGYEIVADATELAGASGERVFGAFATDHMTYVRERAAGSPEPRLPDMAMKAIDLLDRDPDGFFLMIEGARIDMAGHGNDLGNTLGETEDFDRTVDRVAAWAAGRDDVTLIVTADHECGGLEVVAPAAVGVEPQVSWRWGNHTNARVDVFAGGPLADTFDGALRDHRWVHAVAAARLRGEALVEPAPVLIPDGNLADLRHTAATQVNASGFGEGFNQLDALRLDADARGLAIGIEGLFEWDANAVVVLIDVDHGDGTGHATLAGALSDTDGLADAILTGSLLEAPAVTGFGADLALVAFGGADPQLEVLADRAGLRGLRAPFGLPDDLGWHGVAINFGEDVRARDAALTASAGEGLEAFIPWDRLYPDLGGAVPTGATLSLAAVLVNDDGDFTSNQALPPFPAGTANPGATLTALPGLVVWTVDADNDGTADGDAAPQIAP